MSELGADDKASKLNSPAARCLLQRGFRPPSLDSENGVKTREALQNFANAGANAEKALGFYRSRGYPPRQESFGAGADTAGRL